MKPTSTNFTRTRRRAVAGFPLVARPIRCHPRGPPHRSNRSKSYWVRQRSPGASIASTNARTGASRSWTIRRAKRAIRRMPTRACSCPFTQLPRREVGIQGRRTEFSQPGREHSGDHDPHSDITTDGGARSRGGGGPGNRRRHIRSEDRASIAASVHTGALSREEEKRIPRRLRKRNSLRGEAHRTKLWQLRSRSRNLLQKLRGRSCASPVCFY